MSDDLFVYGTLMPGEARWPILEHYTDSAPKRDRIKGRIFDTGAGYPALADLETDRDVRGWVVTLEPTQRANALRVLDRIEGTDAGLFARTATVTEAGRRCWVYRYLHETAGLEDLDGRWASEVQRPP